MNPVQLLRRLRELRIKVTVDGDKLRYLTYTSDPLREALEVTGHSVIRAHVTASRADADVFLYPQEVDEEGGSSYVTKGVLRASHRAIEPAPYDNLGLPYHPGTAESLFELGAEPVELVFDLHPTSKLFRAGRRTRVAITGCDRDNAEFVELVPPPVVTVHRCSRYPSAIHLPVVPVVSREVST